MSAQIYSIGGCGPKWRARSLLASVVIVAVLFLAVGCGPQVAEVKGSIEYKGKPVTSGYVTMIGATGIPQQAPINEDGSYKLAAVPVGAVKILVTSPPLEVKSDPKRPTERLDPDTGKPIPRAEAEVGMISTKTQKDTWRQLPPEFGDVRQSKLTYTVNSGTNQHQIKLD